MLPSANNQILVHPQINIPFPPAVCGQSKSLSAAASSGRNGLEKFSRFNSGNRRAIVSATPTVSASVNVQTE